MASDAGTVDETGEPPGPAAVLGESFRWFGEQATAGAALHDPALAAA